MISSANWIKHSTSPKDEFYFFFVLFLQQHQRIRIVHENIRHLAFFPSLSPNPPNRIHNNKCNLSSLKNSRNYFREWVGGGGGGGVNVEKKD